MVDVNTNKLADAVELLAAMHDTYANTSLDIRLALLNGHTFGNEYPARIYELVTQDIRLALELIASSVVQDAGDYVVLSDEEGTYTLAEVGN